MSEMANTQTPHDSPIKSFPHSGIGLVQKISKEKLRADLRAVMQNKITIISPEKFFEEFVPEAKDKRPDETKNIFKSLKAEVFSPERNMYGPITKALNDAKLCPEFTFVSTPYKGDEKVETKEAVDGGLYPTEGAPQPTKSSSKGPPSYATNWTTIEMCIECKSHSVKYDPFDESKPNKAPVAKERLRVLGQILAYAQLLYDNQQRTSQFMLLFLGTSARIVHIDRSGIFATEKFHYKRDATRVVEFVWRLARMDPSKRGHDTTAERVPHSSTVGMAMKAIAEKVADDSEDYAHLQFRKLLNSSSTWWRLTVKDELAVEGAKKERKFLVGQPHFSAPGVSGRGTRGYIALDVDSLSFDAGGLSLEPDGIALDADKLGTPKFVYLKDAWRVVHEDIDKEGDTLRTLNGFKVRHVPTVLHHGDLGQITRSPELWVTYHPDVAPGTRCPLKKHSHYRLVVKEVGRPLEDFADSEALISAIYCCVKAHSEAYAHGIIHRDISVGNMLIYDNGVREYGLLNDWELSKRLDDHNLEGRQLDRTGTWEFLSVFALDDPKKKILVQDELESFFHALLYMAIRFFPHNCKNVGAFIYDYFEDYLQLPNREYRCGPAKKKAIVDGYIDLLNQRVGSYERLVFSLPESNTPHPINEVITDLLSWFSAYYRLNQKEDPLFSLSDKEAQGALPQSTRKDTSTKRRELGIHSDSDEPDGSESSDSESEEDDVTTSNLKQERRMRRRAQKIDTHRPFLLYLKAALKPRSRWPKDDKGPDKKPVGRHNARSSHELLSESLSGTLPISGALTLEGTISGTMLVPSPLVENTARSDPGVPSLRTRRSKRPSSHVDGLEPPSTPVKRVQRG